MTDVVTRSGKGAPLSYDEADANFTRLAQEKYGQGANVSFGSVTFAGLLATGSVSADTTTVVLANGVTDPAFKMVARSGQAGFTGAIQGEIGLSYGGAPIQAGMRLVRGSIGSDAAMLLLAGNAVVAMFLANGHVLFGGATDRGAKLDVNGSIFQPGGTQFQITGSPGSTGLQMIGQDGADNIIGTMGAGEDLVMRAGSSEIARLKQASKSLLVTGGGGLGYGTGSGSAITQATDKTTAVTLHKSNGVITTASTALAAGASVSFTLTNNQIAATDILDVGVQWSGVTPENYKVRSSCGAGAARITLENVSGGSLSQAVPINFGLLKVVNA